MRTPARAVLCTAAAAFALLAATPAPLPTRVRVDLTKVQPASLLPKVALHTEFIVAVNKMGQVTRIISGRPSRDRAYNLHTAGNALQAFIRTPDGKAVSGTYKLTYDYDPKTTHVRRDVALLRAGSVNPDEEGAVNKMVDDLRKHAKAATPGPERSAAMTPGPQPSGTERLPGLGQILKTAPP